MKRDLRTGGLRVQGESGAWLTIHGGNVNRDEITRLKLLSRATASPSALSRGIHAAGGAALGMIFSPAGAAIGAGIGATIAKGRSTLRIEITTPSETHIITIAESDARTLERAARRPIE